MLPLEAAPDARQSVDTRSIIASYWHSYISHLHSHCQCPEASQVMRGNAAIGSVFCSFGVVMWEVVTHQTPQRGALRAINVPEEGPPGVGACCVAFRLLSFLVLDDSQSAASELTAGLLV